MKGHRKRGPEETVSQPVPPLRGSIIFPLDRGLTPAANTNAAAARLLGPDFHGFVPPSKFISGRDTVSEGPLYPSKASNRVFQWPVKPCPDTKRPQMRLFQWPIGRDTRHTSVMTAAAATAGVVAAAPPAEAQARGWDA
jgi:hypothetical protein